MEALVNLYHMLTFELDPENQWQYAGVLQCQLDAIPLYGERQVYRILQLKIQEMNSILDNDEEKKTTIQIDETKNVTHTIPSR